MKSFNFLFSLTLIMFTLSAHSAQSGDDCGEILTEYVEPPIPFDAEIALAWEGQHLSERTRLEKKISNYRKRTGHYKNTSDRLRSQKISLLNQWLHFGQINKVISEFRTLFREVEIAGLRIREYRENQFDPPLDERQRIEMARHYATIGTNYGDYRAVRVLLEKIVENEDDFYSETYKETARKALEELGLNDIDREVYQNIIGATLRPEIGELDRYHAQPASLIRKLQIDLHNERRAFVGLVMTNTAELISGVKLMRHLAHLKKFIPQVVRDTFARLFRGYRDNLILKNYYDTIVEVTILPVSTRNKLDYLMEKSAKPEDRQLLITFSRLVGEYDTWSKLLKEAADLSKDKSLHETTRQKYQSFYEEMLEADKTGQTPSYGRLSPNNPTNTANHTARWIVFSATAAVAAYYYAGTFPEVELPFWNQLDWVVQRAVATGQDAVQMATEYFIETSDN